MDGDKGQCSPGDCRSPFFGVLIAGAFDTVIASRAQEAQRELEADDAKSQRELRPSMLKNSESWTGESTKCCITDLLDQMGQMLLNEDLRNSEEDSDLRTLRGRDIVGVRAVQCGGQEIALVFLHEATSK